MLLKAQFSKTRQQNTRTSSAKEIVSVLTAPLLLVDALVRRETSPGDIISCSGPEQDSRQYTRLVTTHWGQTCKRVFTLSSEAGTLALSESESAANCIASEQ